MRHHRTPSGGDAAHGLARDSPKRLCRALASGNRAYRRDGLVAGHRRTRGGYFRLRGAMWRATGYWRPGWDGEYADVRNGSGTPTVRREADSLWAISQVQRRPPLCETLP